jgi:hypothetical protein
VIRQAVDALTRRVEIQTMTAVQQSVAGGSFWKGAGLRTRLLSGLVAAALAVPITAAGPARPAQAAETCDYGFICDVNDFGQMALTLAQLGGTGQLTPAQIMEAALQIIGVVSSVEGEIILHLDAIAAAQWVGAARWHVLEFQDVAVFDEETLEDWAQSVTGAATQATSAFNAVSDRKIANDIGVAMHALYPIALTARTRAGFGTTTLRTYYRQAMEAIVRKLEPRCTPSPGDLDPHPSVYLVEHRCTTPDGRSILLRDYQYFGEWREGPYTEESLRLEAGKNTSWDGARMILQAMDQ